MNELIKIEVNEKEEQVVSGRALHDLLGIETRYNDWFARMCEYGFEPNKDFYSILSKTPDGGRPSTDHILKLDMAKELCMLARSEQGKKARQYFIQVEKDWNSPEKLMARALMVANKQLNTLRLENAEVKKELQEAAPKVTFANAVAGSQNSILIRDLAKTIAQNGVDIGERRLFDWLRKNKYLTLTNMPTQRSIELEVMEVIERVIARSTSSETRFTAKITAKGQIYFVNKFLAEAVAV